MVQDNEVHTADPAAVLEFLRKTLPFNELDDGVLWDVAKKCTEDFYPKGTLIFQQDVTEVTHLYLIFRGGVKVYLTDANLAVTLKDFRGEGGYFGALSIIRDSKASFNVETIEDTFCFLLERDPFLELVRNNSRIAQVLSENIFGRRREYGIF